MIAFVILHYGGIDDTKKCIESILTNLHDEDVKIIVVDNKSTDLSGIDLKDFYSGNNLVHVILNDVNNGFSSGNNIGCNYAIENFSPDFLCVFNNDIYIDDNKFVKKIREIYQLEQFDVLGPKIWNTKRKYNQNPFKVISSIEEIRYALGRKKTADKILNSKFPYLYYLFNRLNKDKSEKKEGLHGAALIFSSKYYNKFDLVFPELAFLYNEENFLYYRKLKNDLVFTYNQNIVVYHNHSSSTRKMTKSTVKKWKFHHNHSKVSLEKLYEVYINHMNI